MVATASTHTWLCLIPDAIYLPELGLLFARDRNQVHGLNERQVLSHMTAWILSSLLQKALSGSRKYSVPGPQANALDAIWLEFETPGM